MFDWFDKWSEAVAAFSTLGLVIFAGIQIMLEVSRRGAERRAASIHARGPAWLARRALEGAAPSRPVNDPRGWAWGVPRDHFFDSLEKRLLETLRLASMAGGSEADAANQALNSFLAFVDRVNALKAYTLSTEYDPYSGGVDVNSVDVANMGVLFDEATGHLYDTISRLAEIAPRQPHEPPMPEVLRRRMGGRLTSGPQEAVHAKSGMRV